MIRVISKLAQVTVTPPSKSARPWKPSLTPEQARQLQTVQPSRTLWDMTKTLLTTDPRHPPSGFTLTRQLLDKLNRDLDAKISYWNRLIETATMNKDENKRRNALLKAAESLRKDSDLQQYINSNDNSNPVVIASKELLAFLENQYTAKLDDYSLRSQWNERVKKLNQAIDRGAAHQKQ